MPYRWIRSAGPRRHAKLHLAGMASCLFLLALVLGSERISPWWRHFAKETPARPGSVAHPALALADSTEKPAKGKFLVASRSLRGPYFAETVVLLLDYNREGAMGLIINEPTDVKLAELLPEMDGVQRRSDVAYIGGPVAQTGIILLIRSKVEPEESRHVFADIYVSASRDVLEQLVGEGASGPSFRAYVGYAGWAPGQLDSEVARGSWHILPGDAATIFDPSPEEVWKRLIRRTQLRFALLEMSTVSSREGISLDGRNSSHCRTSVPLQSCPFLSGGAGRCG